MAVYRDTASKQLTTQVTLVKSHKVLPCPVPPIGLSDSYVAPEPVSNVKMSAESSYIYVTWSYSAAVYSPFSLVLNSSADNITYNGTTDDRSFNFTNLKTATYYTVYVSSTILTTILSSPQSISCFTGKCVFISFLPLCVFRSLFGLCYMISACNLSLQLLQFIS